MTPEPLETASTKSASEPGAPPRAEPERKRSLWWLWLLLLGVLGGAGYWLYPRIVKSLSKSGTPGGAPAAARPVPVVVATARKGDMNLYLTGLGFATALKTVTIRTRVDGQLDKVTFVEGQLVHEGDLLAQIDPRPFQVQLAQAEGQLAKD